MTMNPVGQPNAVRSARLHRIMDEDIVYSVIERYSRKASEPTTTRSSSTSSLIIVKEALIIKVSFIFHKRFNFLNSQSLYTTDQ